jgi:hypothetical protein
MEFEYYTRRAANSGKVLAHETLRVMDGGSAWIETKTLDSLIAGFVLKCGSAISSQSTLSL